ncbi:MAG: hypothetical protein U0587_08660 [Candidatus Binatia bacterium]
MGRIESAGNNSDLKKTVHVELVTAFFAALVVGVPIASVWYGSPPWAQALLMGSYAAGFAYILWVPYEQDLHNLREGARIEVDNLRDELNARLDDYADRIYALEAAIGPNPDLPCHPLVPPDLQPEPGIVDELNDHARRLRVLELTIGRLQGAK